MTTLEKVNDRLFEITRKASILMFIAMVILSIVQVVCRYVLEISLSFTEELARFIFIWVTFLGTAMAMKKGQHVKMELLLGAVPPFIRNFFEFVGRVISMCIYLVMIGGGIAVMWKTMDQTSAALNLPMSFVYLAVPVCGVLMLLIGLNGGAKANAETGGSDL